MDTTWALLSSFLSCIIVWLLVSALLTKKKKTTNNPNDKVVKLPPSGPSIPILGKLLWLRRSFLEVSPTLRRLRTELGPVVTFNFGIFPCIVVIDRHLAHEALVQKGTAFSGRPPYVGVASSIYSSNGHTVNTSHGPIWRQLRRNLISEILNPSRLRSYAGARRRALGQLLDDLLLTQATAREGIVLISEVFHQCLSRLFAVMCFGDTLEGKVVRELEHAQRDINAIVWKLNVFDLVPLSKFFLWGRWREFLDIRRRQEELMIPLIKARASAKQQKQQQQQDGSGSVPCYVDTLLDLELESEGYRKLGDEEIVSLCSEFLSAGVHTTAMTMEWAMANLVRYPHVQQELFEEITRVVPRGREIKEEDLQRMPYLQAVILETLRRHPPGPLLLPHAMLEAASLGGCTIPKGSVVNFAVAEMGWDGEVWEEPFEFRPERFLEGEGVDISGFSKGEIKMMPFGAGRRICPGLGTAMLHLQYCMASLVREFEWKTPVDGEEVDMSEKLEMSVIMKNPLRARIIPRTSASNLDNISVGSNSGHYL